MSVAPRRALLTVLVVALGGCSQAVPGDAVVTARVTAGAEQYRICSAGVATTTSDVDTLLDGFDRQPSGSPVDDAAVRRFFEGMRRTLDGSCGHWAKQSRAQSAVVLHLAEQPLARSPTARMAITSMIVSICGAVEGPLDRHGVTLSTRAHAVCAVR